MIPVTQTDNTDKEGSGESQDWLMTYGDLMSLLLCLFVMLYALSTLQTTKIQSVTESLRGGFGLFGNGSKMFKPVTATKPAGQRIGGGILFDWGSEDLTAEAKAELDGIYLQLIDVQNRVQIVGSAGVGEPSSYRRDWDLAYARAINVWDYLASLGMDRERCQIIQQTGKNAGAMVEIQYVQESQ